MYEFQILCETSKGTFDISHKIWNPYTTKNAFYWLLFLCVAYDIFELWRHKPSWDWPLIYNLYALYVGMLLLISWFYADICGMV